MDKLPPITEPDLSHLRRELQLIPGCRKDDAVSEIWVGYFEAMNSRKPNIGRATIRHLKKWDMRARRRAAHEMLEADLPRPENSEELSGLQAILDGLTSKEYDKLSSVEIEAILNEETAK